MTPDEIAIAIALKDVVFPYHSDAKRFAETMRRNAEFLPNVNLTPRQSNYLKSIAIQFREQLPENIVRLGLKTEPKKEPQ